MDGLELIGLHYPRSTVDTSRLSTAMAGAVQAEDGRAYITLLRQHLTVTELQQLYRDITTWHSSEITDGASGGHDTPIVTRMRRPTEPR